MRVRPGPRAAFFLIMCPPVAIKIDDLDSSMRGGVAGMTTVTALSHRLYNKFINAISLCTIPFFLIRRLWHRALLRLGPEASLFLTKKVLILKGALHRERRGLYSSKVVQKLKQRPSVWIHAASVGEVKVALTLLMEMKKVYPHYGFVISTTTLQGRAVASQAHGVDAAFLAPLDLPWIVRRALKRIKPRILLVTETELWPNLIKEVKRAGTPIILFNGRISQRSYRFYRPLRFFFRGVMQKFDALCVKSDVDGERMVSLGAPPQCIHVTGDLKFHQLAPPTKIKKKQLSQELKLPKDIPVLIAGSTHEGEEAIIIRIFKELQVDFPQLILILAPRHLQRVSRVEELLKSQGIRWTRRTILAEGHRAHEVILLDTVGELAALYGLGTAIFVGGSFCRVGGHNILEVLAQGKGVIFGPHMENFSEIARLVVEKGAGIQVRTPDELKDTLAKVIADPSVSHTMGEKGRALLKEQEGALEKTVKIVKEIFKK